MELEVFLKKFRELKAKSPRLFSSSRENENSLYTEEVAYSKNAYYLFTGAWIEDCYYGSFFIKCRECVDNTKIQDCELCYECVDCLQCYNGNFLVNCRGTRDSEFCFDLQNCEHCFLSRNLRHKSYVFQNQQYSKEEYFQKVLEYKKTHSLEQIHGDLSRLMLSAARPDMFLLNTENCTGDQIVNSKNVFHGFDVVNAEDFFYCEESGYGRDCCDCLVTSGELNYECFGVSKNAYNNSFCIDCTTCVNCEFCMTCYNLNDCFACFYLKGKQFHILNVAYSPEDYKKEVTQLKKELYNAGLYRLDFLKTPTASS